MSPRTRTSTCCVIACATGSKSRPRSRAPPPARAAMIENGDRYRRKLLFLLSSATFFEGYDFVLAFVLALVLGDLGGSEADAGWIRAITQLGAVDGVRARGTGRPDRPQAAAPRHDRGLHRDDRPHGRQPGPRVANRRAVRRAGLPRRGVGGRDHDRGRGIPPGAPGTSPGHRDVDEHARRDLRRAACLHRVAEPRPRLAGLLPRRAAPARADRVRPPLDARDGPLRSRADEHLDHTSLLEPWRPAYRTTVLAVGLVRSSGTSSSRRARSGGRTTRSRRSG